MKPINLLSLCSSWKKLSESVFDDYANMYDINMKTEELDDLNSLVNELKLKNIDHKIYDCFFVGYSINQIGKEFDLLRIGENSIINIELKRKNTGHKITDQLKRNRYYLSFLDKEILNFTYVREENKLYTLDESGHLCESNIQLLADELYKQKVIIFEDIDRLFDPTNYLVSPFNSTEAFLQGNYFLTKQQEEIKKSIMSSKSEKSSNFISIYGAAGTGKTLLTYDIAKSYISENKNVIIFHCGKLNSGHYKLHDAGFREIEPIKSLNAYLKDNQLKDFDLVIFDEVQRIYSHQIASAIAAIKQGGNKCVFSYDSKQCLSTSESTRNIPDFLDTEASPAKFNLTEKIRTNKEIATFIKNLFDMSKQNHDQKYSNIEISYFSNEKEVRESLMLLGSQGWKSISYTPSLHTSSPFDKYQTFRNDNAHEVIGQEFDNVVAVMDRHFYYNQNGELSYNRNTYYNATKMLFQIVTRTRKKLHIIIMDNEEILKHCIAILNRSELKKN